MGGIRSSDRRRRLLAGTVALGLLASVAATTAAAAQEPPAPDPPSDQQPEPTTDEPAQAPVDWTTEPTPTSAPPGTDPADGTDTTTPPPAATEPSPPTAGTSSATPPADAGTTTTGTTAPTGDGALEPPSPVVGAANPFAGAQGFAVLVSGELRGGGTSAGAVAAGGDIAADAYAVAGTTSTFGEPVAALAGGRITGSLTTDPAGAVASGVADPGAPAGPAVRAAPGAYEQGFAGVFDDLAARSRSLASMPVTVTPTDAAGTPLADLAGADVHLALQPGLNTWTVSADDLAAVASLTVDGTPSADQPLVVSVTGADVTLDRPAIVSPDGDAGLLWNLPDATTATVGAALPGSLLASGGAVTLRADLGGTLVAASLDQQAPAAVGAVPFGADLPTADEVAVGDQAGEPAAAVPVPDPDGPSVFLVPTPGAGEAVISVKVGGDRTGIIGVTPLAGVVLQLYDGGAGGGTIPVADSWATCTSDADGDCSFVVPNTAVGGANAGRRFWVRQVSAPAGWFANDDLRVGASPTSPDLYEFRTPANLSAGNTYLTTGPTASWMLGTGTATTASGGIWQNSRTNPAFPAQCGLRVALVLDVSGSAPQAGVRTAGTAFVSGLSGTPSEVAVFTFSSDAPANSTNNQNRPLTSVSTAANVTTVNGWINGVTTGGGTNWDRGMAQVAESTTDFDVAVVVTDGDPTFYNQPFEGPGSSTRFREIENSIFSANAIKAEGTRVVAVGVGAGVSGGAQNLIAVSGPTVNSDYFQTSNYTAAAATLRALALGSCQGAISVVKQVVPNGTPAGSTAGASSAGGWDFAASTTTTGVTIDPPAGTTAAATGALSFGLSFPGGTTSAPVSITETLQPGFTLHEGAVGQNAVCTRLDTGASVPITNLPSGFTVTGSSTFPVSCLVYNQAPPLVVPASIQVDKTWVVDGVSFPDGSQPTGLTADLVLDGSAQPWGTARTGLIAGDSVGIAENVTISLPLCTLADQVLTPVTPAGPPGSLPDEVELVGGANLYSVTNTVTCQAQLTLVKEVVPAGAVNPNLWALDAAAPAGAAPGPSGTTGATSLVTPLELYTLSESGGDPRFAQRVGPNAVPIPGSTVSWACVLVDETGAPIPPGTVFDGLNGGVRPPLGQRTSCTATNVAVPLTLVKTVVNDDGGTATPADFQLTATPVGPLPLPAGLGPVTVPGSATGIEVLVRPGVAYVLSETGPDGYVETSLVCQVADQTPPPRQVVIGFGQAGICTFTNDDQPATLTLEKTVTNDNGGTAVPTAWTLAAGGPTPISGVTGSPTVTGVAVDSGTYTLSESGGPAGYTPGAWSCDAGTLTGSSLVLTPGVDATCTIANDDQPATLTLVKTVTNDNGGTAAPTAWTLAAGGPTPISGASGTAPVTAAPVSAGTYALSESGGPAGYSPGAWSCTGGTLTGASLVLTPGVSATCTIANDDQPATLTLVKTVTNDNGGTAAPTDWTLTGTGPTPISGVTGSPAVTAAPVNAGTYALAESGGPAGYIASGWTCTGGTITGTSITLAVGQTASCSIDNDDQPATLTLVKTVSNDNGGTAAPTDWTLAADGPTAISGTSGSPAVTAAPVSAGTYALSESGGPAGYSPGAWSCTGGTLTGSSLVLTSGVSATCTIANDDQAASLTLVKTVTNDNGGTAAPTAWTLAAGGPTPISGASGSTAVTAAPVSAGTYALSESGGPAGYTAGAWSCTAGTLTGASLVLTPGVAATCTIANDDQPATLTLVKTVTNDNGGTAAPTAWTLAAGGPTPISGASGSTAVTAAPVSAGTYALSESGGPAGYTAGAWSCTAGTLTGASLVLTPGVAATCTIANDDQPATLTLVKTVTNDHGGTAVPTAWTLAAGGPTPLSGPTGDPAVTAAPVSAGTYALAESGGPAGYTPGAWSCTGGALTGASLVLTVGQTATCTIANDDDPAMLTLEKVVDAGSTGSTRVPADWTVTATPDAVPGQDTVTGNGDPASAGGVSAVAISLGAYDLSEAGPAGFTAGTWTCTGATVTGTLVTVTDPVDVVCTITNTAVAPVLTLVKQVDNGTTGTAVATDWTLSATGPVTISGPTGGPAVTAVPVEVGAYDLAEAGPEGYTASDWACTAAVGEAPPAAADVVAGSVSLTEGVAATCTIVNTVLPPGPPTTVPPTTTPPTSAPAPPPEQAGPADPCAATITPVMADRPAWCDPLPWTGASVVGLLVAAAVLIGVGVPLLLVYRRRRTPVG